MTLRGFHRTMSVVDDRLPEMTQGLGILEGREGVFYPINRIPPQGIRIIWHDQPICIGNCEIDRLPYTVFEHDQDHRPMQLLMRWYGFSLTTADVRVYSEDEEHTDGRTFSR